MATMAALLTVGTVSAAATATSHSTERRPSAWRSATRCQAESFDMPAAEKSMIGALVARGAKAVVVGMIDVGDCADTILWITGKCGVEKRVGMVSVAGKWLVSSIN